jgi:hypothetical protein
LELLGGRTVVFFYSRRKGIAVHCPASPPAASFHNYKIRKTIVLDLALLR